MVKGRRLDWAVMRLVSYSAWLDKERAFAVVVAGAWMGLEGQVGGVSGQDPVAGPPAEAEVEQAAEVEGGHAGV